MTLTNSHDIIKSIFGSLFPSEARRHQNWINQLATKNQKARGDLSPTGFQYAGGYYHPDWLGRGNWPKPTLHESLWSEMDKFIEDKRIIESDEQYIRQSLFALLKPCVTFQDVRDALPECLISCVSGYGDIPRTRDEAFTIINNDRAYRQFKDILPRMELYAAAKLIY